MNVDAVWHDLECGGYGEDLALWRTLAARTGGPVLDVGAGTGRVTLELAAQGIEVVALDLVAPLLAALSVRAGEAGDLRVDTVVADARGFRLDRRFSLIVAPMQTLQLFEGRRGRIAFFRRALEHLKPGGLLAAAVADALDCFDDEHALPPPPETRRVLDATYTSRLLWVAEEDGCAAIHRRRQVVRGDDRRETQHVVVRLDRVSADEVASEAQSVGFIAEPHLCIPETERYLGSTVVVVRAP